MDTPKSKTPTLKRHNSFTSKTSKASKSERESARRTLIHSLPPETPSECEQFIRNPFKKENWIRMKDQCEDPPINWDKIYQFPASKIKKEICRDHYYNPTKIPTIREIPDDKRLYLPNLGSLNHRLHLWCSDPTNLYHENLFKGKFKHTLYGTEDLPFIYSKFAPVSKSKFVAPLVMSSEVVNEILSGNILVKYILLKYLQRKHNNACIIVENTDSINFSFNIRLIPNSEIDTIRQSYIDRRANPDDYIIIIGQTADTSKLYTAHKMVSTPNLKRIYDNCKHRYILGILEITNLDMPLNTHNNAYIIDKRTKRFYLYEPHGLITHWQPLLIKFLQKHLNTVLGEELTIIPFGGTCDARGIQLLEEEEAHSPIFDELIKDPEGYCSYYSAWILDMVLENPGILPYNIPKLAYRNIRSLKDFIRGFGVFINAIIIDYLSILKNNFKPSERTIKLRENLIETLIDFYLDIDEET